LSKSKSVYGLIELSPAVASEPSGGNSEKLGDTSITVSPSSLKER
jgi:hypothetical protein